jgi:hypothetical protein
MNNVFKFIVFFLFFTKLFQYVDFNIKSSVLTLALACFVGLEFKKKNEFSFLIKLFVCCIFFSCISSYIYRDQTNLFTTFTQCYFYLSLAFYFVCSWLKIKIYELEKSLVLVGFISIGAYFLQNAVYPTVIFADATNDYSSELRIRMCGSLIYSFLFFFGINRYVINKSLKYLLCSVLAFICIIIMGFRSLTVSLLALGALEYFYVSGVSVKRLKQLLPLILIVIVVSQIDIVQNKVAEMLARQERGDSFDNSDYIRFVEFDYYWNYYFKDSYERFFGSGLPVQGTAFYNLEMKNFSYNLFWNDWGLLGMSWIFGIPTVIILYFMYIKVIVSKLPKEYTYLKAIFAFLILTSLTSAEAFRPGNLLLQGAFLYLVMSIKNSIKQI